MTSESTYGLDMGSATFAVEMKNHLVCNRPQSATSMRLPNGSFMVFVDYRVHGLLFDRVRCQHENVVAVER
jgi:hypothetical protein